MERFRKRRWRLVSAPPSNNCRYRCSRTAYIVLTFDKHNSLPHGPKQAFTSFHQRAPCTNYNPKCLRCLTFPKDQLSSQTGPKIPVEGFIAITFPSCELCGFPINLTEMKNELLLINFLKMVRYCLSSLFSYSNFNYILVYNSNYRTFKKHRFCAWDSNPGPQNGRHWRFYWAMVATLIDLFSKF